PRIVQIPIEPFVLINITYQNYSTSKYVYEEPMLNLFSGSNWFSSFFAERRPLCPERETRIRQPAVNVEKCQILVQIIRGANIPLRKEDETTFQDYRAQRLRQEEIQGMEKKTSHTE